MPSGNKPTMTKGFQWPVKISISIKPLAERHFISLSVILMIVGMLLMARENPELWEVELFKTLLTAITITGFLNMILSFHFSASKEDEKKTENTHKAFEAIAETAKASGSTDVRQAAAKAAEQTADAAKAEAEHIAEDVLK